jgi:hypothetical protein
VPSSIMKNCQHAWQKVQDSSRKHLRRNKRASYLYPIAGAKN